MTPDLVFRIATPDDIRQIIDLFNEESIQYWTLPLGVKPADAASAWHEIVRQGEVVCAFQGMRLYGCCATFVGQVCFAVFPDARMKGLASRLLACSVERAQGRGGLKLSGIVRRGNAGAQATLEKHGFRFDGLLPYKNKTYSETLSSYSRWCE